MCAELRDNIAEFSVLHRKPQEKTNVWSEMPE